MSIQTRFVAILILCSTILAVLTPNLTAGEKTWKDVIGNKDFGGHITFAWDFDFNKEIRKIWANADTRLGITLFERLFPLVGADFALGNFAGPIAPPIADTSPHFPMDNWLGHFSAHCFGYCVYSEDAMNLRYNKSCPECKRTYSIAQETCENPECKFDFVNREHELTYGKNNVSSSMKKCPKCKRKNSISQDTCENPQCGYKFEDSSLTELFKLQKYYKKQLVSINYPVGPVTLGIRCGGTLKATIEPKFKPSTKMEYYPGNGKDPSIRMERDMIGFKVEAGPSVSSKVFVEGDVNAYVLRGGVGANLTLFDGYAKLIGFFGFNTGEHRYQNGKHLALEKLITLSMGLNTLKGSIYAYLDRRGLSCGWTGCSFKWKRWIKVIITEWKGYMFKFKDKILYTEGIDIKSDFKESAPWENKGLL